MYKMIYYFIINSWSNRDSWRRRRRRRVLVTKVWSSQLLALEVALATTLSSGSPYTREMSLRSATFTTISHDTDTIHNSVSQNFYYLTEELTSLKLPVVSKY